MPDGYLLPQPESSLLLQCFTYWSGWLASPERTRALALLLGVGDMRLRVASRHRADDPFGVRPDLPQLGDGFDLGLRVDLVGEHGRSAGELVVGALRVADGYSDAEDDPQCFLPRFAQAVIVVDLESLVVQHAVDELVGQQVQCVAVVLVEDDDLLVVLVRRRAVRAEDDDRSEVHGEVVADHPLHSAVVVGNLTHRAELCDSGTSVHDRDGHTRLEELDVGTVLVDPGDDLVGNEQRTTALENEEALGVTARSGVSGRQNRVLRGEGHGTQLLVS